MDKKKLLLLAAAVGFLVVVFGNHHFRRLIIYKRNKKILLKQLNDLKKQNDELLRAIKEFEKNPDNAYYKVAREKYGMIKNGELKYRFVDK